MQWQWAFFTPGCWLSCLSLNLIRLSSNPMFAGEYESCMKAESGWFHKVSGRLIGPRLPQMASKLPSPPLFLIPRNHINLLYHIKLPTQEPTLYTLQDSENPKCLIIPATMSTLLIIIILLTMCGITVRWLMRSLKFWPGYLHLSPRDATRIFELVGLMMSATGSCILRNIGMVWWYSWG